MSRKRLFVFAIAGAAIVGVLGVVVAPSHATPPGKNGQIAFRRYFNDAHTLGAVFTINASGGSERRVTRPPRGIVDDQPDWAPHGSLITFSRCRRQPEGRCAVYTVRPDGSSLTLVSTCPPDATNPKCSDDNVRTFSPDGRQIAFGSGHGDKFDMVLADVQSGEQHVVFRATKTYDLSDPQFSPDGKRLAFIRITSSSGQAIFTANLDGTDLHRLTPWRLVAGDNEDWSPNGKWILFRSYEEDVQGKQSQIYVVHPDGSGLKQLTHFKRGAIVTSSSYSPDGKWIVLATNGIGGNADLFVMRPDGSRMHAITRTKVWDSAPDWGPS